MNISCGLAPGLAVVERAQLAESLGYDRVWLYDSPAIYLDVWVSLARVAEHTDRIGLGTAVLVPSLRHVVATAAAVAGIEDAAPGRLACGFGTGATARWTLGQDALSLKATGDYLGQLRGLLRGDVVEIDGEKVQMCHLPGYAPARPIDVPILLSALGPKGQALAHQVADGIMTVGFGLGGFDWSAQLVAGTVLDPGESLASPGMEKLRNQNYDDYYANDGEDVHSALLTLRDDSVRRACPPLRIRRYWINNVIPPMDGPAQQLARQVKGVVIATAYSPDNRPLRRVETARG